MIGSRPVAVLGAGLAGLTAANYLYKNSVPVRVYEAGKDIAGLASTFREDGFTYDFGAHFITNRLAEAVGIAGECRNVPYYGESVHLRGHTYSYPLGLMCNPRFLSSALCSKLARGRDGDTAVSLQERFHQLYGRVLADEVAIPLAEAWSGFAASELAPSVADKLPLSLARLIYLTVMKRISGRAIAIGYGKEKPESVNVWHVYPEGGTGQMCKHLAEPIRPLISLESGVEAIFVEGRRVAAIQVNGRTEEVSAVISTAPCNILPGLLKGTSRLNFLWRFRFRPMVFVMLQLTGRNLLKDAVVWTPETRFPFFRATETPISMPWLAPEGKTLITLDLGCEVGDNIWKSKEDELATLCLNKLEHMIPDVRKRYLGVRVLRTPHAYPVFLRDYEEQRLDFQRSTGIKSLYSMGRNGEFDHLLTEDVYWRTLARMKHLLPTLAREAELEKRAAHHG